MADKSPSSDQAGPERGADTVSALERGFRVLDCFAAARRPLSNSEVAAMTGIPRPTMTRLIATLQELGHLRLAGMPDRWEIGSGVVRLAEAFLGGLDIRASARPHMIELAETVGSTCFLGIRDADDMLVVETARSRAVIAVIAADVGTRMSITRSALGRAWLSGADDATRNAVLRNCNCDAKTKQSLTSALVDARRNGYALSLGDWHPAINAAAVAIRTPKGEVISINSGGPSFVISAGKLVEEVVPALLTAADAIAREIGGKSGREIVQAGV